ncbi:MAG: LacI family transcriptional regulator [Chloroflexi bacterium]|nr:MAG: LacI family transcriptional regulator [Chloroflexota bacterium]
MGEGVRRVTIHDVAGKAGVSTAAVSHAFNDPERLRASTVTRILDAARELGYAPNPHARALHSQRIGVLGVLFPQPIATVFANPFFSSFLEGIGSVTDEQGIGLLTVTPLRGSLEHAIASAPVDGFVIIGLDERHTEVAPLRKRGVPFVIVDGDSQTASSVNVDDESGAYAAADFLLDRGHRDVLVLTFETPQEHLDDPRYGVGGRRLRGYRRAFAERSLRMRSDWLIPTSVTLHGGDDAFSTAWVRGARPTAVLAVSDIIAMGTLRAARRLGVRVPEDLEVIGFDDVPLAVASQPALSTVHQPIPEKGRVAIRLLIRELDEGGPRERIVLPTELVLRESTRTFAMPARDEIAGATKGGIESGSKRSLTRAAGNQAAF